MQLAQDSRLIFGILIVSCLSGCSTMFKDEAAIEADKIALKHARAQAFGASGAAFSPDGNLVAIGTRNSIWIANTQTHKTEYRINHHVAARFGGKKSLLFIDDHRLVIGADGGIFLYDMRKRTIADRYPLFGNLQSPRAIAWSNTAELLAFSIGSENESVYLLAIEKDGFGVHRHISGFAGIPSDLKFSRDGQYLAATGDGQDVFIRNIETGEQVGTLPTKGFAENLELFGENRLLVSGEEIALWAFLQEEEALRLENANLQGQVTGQVVTRVAGTIALGTLTAFAAVTLAGLSAFGGSPSVDAAAAIGDLAVATYDVASAPMSTSQQAWCGRSTSVSHDEKWLVDIYPGITKEVIRVFNLNTGEVVKILNPKGEYSCAAKFSPNSKQLLITTEKVARLYNVQTWQFKDLELN